MLSEHLLPQAVEDIQSLDELLTRLAATIDSRTGGNIRQLKVEYLDGGVLLTGTATTYYAKQQATHATIEEFAGLRVDNAINVV